MNRTSWLAGVLVVAGTIFVAGQSAPPAAPQTPQLTFRAQANYVEVDALVTDARGAVIKDLGPDEFEVYEDGVRQRLSVCSFVELPIERADPPLYRTAVQPDVLTNQKPFDGRVYVIVLDGYHIAPMRSAIVRQQARHFVERYVGVNDLAAVVHIGNPTAGQEVTANKFLLTSAIDRFLGAKPRSTTLSLIDSALASQEFDLGVSDLDEPTRVHMAVEALDSLRRLAQHLAGLSGRRKAVLYFSEGIEYNTDDRVAETVVAGGEIMRIVVRDAEAIVSAQHEMIGAATRSNVAIYSIDPRGLATGAEDAILIGALPAGADVPLVEMAADLRRSQDTLRTVSDLTGGRAFVNTNDVTLGFTRLVEDNSLYYVLGYQSTNTKRDGRFHAVTVKVTRPGLEVRARKGYYAPVERDGRAPLPVDPVAGLLASAAPVGGLGMRVGASVLKGPDLRSLVLLTAELSHTDLSFTSEDGLFVNDVDVAYQVLDADGGRRAFDRRTIRLRLRPASRDSAAARGLRYVTEFALPPGRYQLRLVARERAGGRAGSVFYDLTVPDYATAPLALSDLLITTSMVRRTLTAGATPAVSSIFASPTTVSREWSASESLGIFAALYAAETDPPHTIDLRVAVHADHGTRVFLREDRLDSRQLGRDGRGFDYRVTIPLQAFAPGRYVLTVEARSRRGGEAVIKETEFRVMK